MSGQQDEPPENVAAMWRVFRLELELARNYPRSYLLYMGRTHRDPVLEKLLPSLLGIRAAAILEDGLSRAMVQGGLTIPPRYRDDLFGRISVLQESGALANGAELHLIRERRNRVSHEAGVSLDWDSLGRDVEEIQKALERLGIVPSATRLEYHAERSAMKESTEPGIAFTQDFRVWITENDRIAIEYNWTTKTHNA